MLQQLVVLERDSKQGVDVVHVEDEWNLAVHHVRKSLFVSRLPELYLNRVRLQAKMLLEATSVLHGTPLVLKVGPG